MLFAALKNNVALNKMVYQSSVWKDGMGDWPPTLANDGNTQTSSFSVNGAMCAHSQVETNPWWAVDLGGPTTIYRVEFTNRDMAGM